MTEDVTPEPIETPEADTIVPADGSPIDQSSIVEAPLAAEEPPPPQSGDH
jgi:hypothetical protein